MSWNKERGWGDGVGDVRRMGGREGLRGKGEAEVDGEG